MKKTNIQVNKAFIYLKWKKKHSIFTGSQYSFSSYESHNFS